MMQVVVEEVVETYERETTRAQAETKTARNVPMSKPQSDSEVEVRSRREWCPAAVVIMHAPGNPRRRPYRIWTPQPAPMARQLPTSVVKRCPAPRIIRGPI